MKNLGILLLTGLLSAKACAMNNSLWLAERGSQAIDLCIQEYRAIKGNAIPEEIDRVYVYAGKENMGLLFTHGEVGTFGKRSASYRAYLSCGVSLHLDMQVTDLGEGLSLLKGSYADTEKPDLRAERVEELLYLRDGMEFRFEEIQIFSPEKIDALPLEQPAQE